MKFPEDLGVRARRGELDDGEEQRLRQQLLASAEADIAHRAGLAFDGEDQVVAGDDALAARIAERVLTDVRPAPRRRLPVRALLLAALLLAGGTATAAVRPGVFRSVQTAMAHIFRVEPSAPKPAPETPKATPVAARAEPVQVVPEATSAPEAPPEPRAPVLPRAPSKAEPAPQEPPGARAASLYAEANRARHRGDVPAAITLYETIQSEYPRSLEAGAADIPLGVLHTRAGAVEAAVRHFRAYLARSPTGELAQEALWGLSQAYSGAGRDAEARQAWSELVSRYPDSAYASAARSKLGANPK